MNVPGYFFDPEKKRYFKIEGSHTAPTTSAWSADNVKKRKVEDRKADEVLRRLVLNKSRIKRAQVLSNPLTGGFLAREHGIVQDDMVPAMVASGIAEKGSISFVDPRWSPSQNITAMCIIGEDPWTDLGVGYICPDSSSIASTYIPRDRNGRVHRQLLAEYSTPGHRIAPYHESMLDQVSAVKFHRRRGILLIAQSEPNDHASLRVVVPRQLSEDRKAAMTPCWRLGERPITQGIVQAQHNSGYYEINTVTLGPDSSEDIICSVGSNRGILQWKGEHCITLGGSLEWTAPSMAGQSALGNAFHDIFAVEYRRNHESIIFGGGRPGRCFVADSRVRDFEWLSFRHGSSITHIKSLNEFHILVSGTRNMMRIYDIRMVKGPASTVPKKRNRNNPMASPDRSIISFPEYKNNAHNKIGLDIDIEAGIIAAAHDDGKVALHSLRSGHQLKSPDIDQIQANVRDRGPVNALQFEKMSGDPHTSLFVGIGRNLKMYSLGSANLEDEA